MKPEEVPEQLVTLLAKCLRNGHSPEKALSKVLGQYDKIYTKELNDFYQTWWNGGGYGLDVMPDSPAAPITTRDKDPLSQPDKRKWRRVKITFPGNPPVIKIYRTASEAARGEYMAKTSMLGRLNGMYCKHPKAGDPVYEWMEAE